MHILGIVLSFVFALIIMSLKASGKKSKGPPRAGTSPLRPAAPLVARFEPRPLPPPPPPPPPRIEPVAVPELDITPGFQATEEEIQKIAGEIGAGLPVHFTKTQDPMDDHPILALTIGATSTEAPKFTGRACLVLRAHRRGVALRFEAFVFFKERYFFRKGKEVMVRVRFDEAEAVPAGTSFSTDLGSLFFMEPEMFVTKAALCERLKIQIIPQHGNQILTLFDFVIVRPAIDLFLRVTIGEDYRQICRLHHEIVKWIFLLGPKYTYLSKMALKESGHDPGPLDFEKRLAFYSAAENYARRKQTSDITGIGHHNLMLHLYQDAREEVRAALGPLKINQ